MRPQVAIFFMTAHTLMLFSDLLFLDLNLIDVNFTVLIVATIVVGIVSELSLVEHLEVLNTKLGLIPTLKVVVQLLLIQERVLTRHLLIELKLGVELVMLVVLLLTRDPARVLKQVLLDLDVLIVLLDKVDLTVLVLSITLHHLE